MCRGNTTGREKSFEQKLSLSGGAAFLTATVHACGKRCKFPLIALQLIGRGSEQLLAATSVQVVLALLQTCWHTTDQRLQEAMLLAFLNLSVRRFCRRSQSEKKRKPKNEKSIFHHFCRNDIDVYKKRKIHSIGSEGVRAQGAPRAARLQQLSPGGPATLSNGIHPRFQCLDLFSWLWQNVPMKCFF